MKNLRPYQKNLIAGIHENGPRLADSATDSLALHTLKREGYLILMERKFYLTKKGRYFALSNEEKRKIRIANERTLAVLKAVIMATEEANRNQKMKRKEVEAVMSMPINELFPE